MISFYLAVERPKTPNPQPLNTQPPNPETLNPKTVWGCKGFGFPSLHPAWRFMGSYKWGYKSPNYTYNPTLGTYNPTCNYP